MRPAPVAARGRGTCPRPQPDAPIAAAAGPRLAEREGARQPVPVQSGSRCLEYPEDGRFIMRSCLSLPRSWRSRPLRALLARKLSWRMRWNPSGKTRIRKWRMTALAADRIAVILSPDLIRQSFQRTATVVLSALAMRLFGMATRWVGRPGRAGIASRLPEAAMHGPAGPPSTAAPARQRRSRQVPDRSGIRGTAGAWHRGGRPTPRWTIAVDRAQGGWSGGPSAAMIPWQAFIGRRNPGRNWMRHAPSGDRPPPAAWEGNRHVYGVTGLRQSPGVQHRGHARRTIKPWDQTPRKTRRTRRKHSTGSRPSARAAIRSRLAVPWLLGMPPPRQAGLCQIACRKLVLAGIAPGMPQPSQAATCPASASARRPIRWVGRFTLDFR